MNFNTSLLKSMFFHPTTTNYQLPTTNYHQLPTTNYHQLADPHIHSSPPPLNLQIYSCCISLGIRATCIYRNQWYYTSQPANQPANQPPPTTHHLYPCSRWGGVFLSTTLRENRGVPTWFRQLAGTSVFTVAFWCLQNLVNSNKKRKIW
jgi:hypothetical protein